MLGAARQCAGIARACPSDLTPHHLCGQQHSLTAIRVTCRALLPCTRGTAARSAAVLPHALGSRQARNEDMASTIAALAVDVLAEEGRRR